MNTLKKKKKIERNGFQQKDKNKIRIEHQNMLCERSQTGRCDQTS